MPELQDRPLRVFLCHSSNDKPTVRELYRQLDAEGWMDIWLDSERLYPGQDWNFEIEQAVEAADVILVCLSKNSVTKEGYVQRELKSVLDLADYKPEGTLFVIPIRLEECEPPRRLRIWQYADYFPKEDRNRAYQRLLVSLRMRAKRLGLSTENPAEERARREAEERATKEAKDRAEKEKEDRDKIAAEYRAIKVAEEETKKSNEEQKRRQKESPFHGEVSPKEVKGEVTNVGQKQSSRKLNLVLFGIGAIVLLALLCGMYGINSIIQNSLIKNIPNPTPTPTLEKNIPNPTPTPTLEAFATDFGNFFNPQGTPVTEWNGIPIMSQATAGQEFDANNYSFKATATATEAQEFYNAQLTNLGWTQSFSMPGGAEAALMSFEKEDKTLIITVTPAEGSIVVLLTLG